MAVSSGNGDAQRTVAILELLKTSKKDTTPKMAHLLCPICAAPFADRHELKLHLASDAPQHLNCRPYSCVVCTSRFGSHQSLREHYERAHPGVGQRPLNYEPQSDEERKKLNMLNLLVTVAMGVQMGSIQLPEEGPSLVTEIPERIPTTNNQQPLAEPYPLLNRQPTRAAPVPDSFIAQPARGDAADCEVCSEQIPASYLEQCQHVLTDHLNAQPDEAHFAEMLQRCFPEARLFDNMTCTVCEVMLASALTGKKASQAQLLHVESHHMSELGVRLHCPVSNCRNANVIQPSRAALLRHVKQYHGGVLLMGRNDREAKKAYNKMRKEAVQKLERETIRLFPFTPQAVATDPNRRLARPCANNNDGGGEPAPKRVHFAKKDVVIEYVPDDDDGFDNSFDDGDEDVMEEDNMANDGEGEATGDGNAARDDDEEDDGDDTAFFVLR